MSAILDWLTTRRNLLFVGSLWILAWVIPWGSWSVAQENLYLVFFIDMVRLGIAIGVFIGPGIWLYLLLQSHNDTIDQAGVIPIGFVLSVSMIAVIGLIGRVAGFSFDLIQAIFILLGILELILIMLSMPVFHMSRMGGWQLLVRITQNPPLLLSLIMATLMTFNDYLLFVDDTSYLAYLTNWQHSIRLGFTNIVHEASVAEYSRFWLALYPMHQALLSNLSGVPGILLIGNYLELFLVPLAVVTSYWFARVLTLSQKKAGFAVLIQVSLYMWMMGEERPVGIWFYQNMSEDKVSATFILAPVFIVFVLRYLKTFTKHNLFLVLVSGLGLALTHPVILFYFCVIACGLALFSWVTTRTSWHTIFYLLVLFVALMMPYAAIRMIDMASQKYAPFTAEIASTTFESERYIKFADNVFYGLNPGVLQFVDIAPEFSSSRLYQFFRLIPFIMVVCAGIIALPNYKKCWFYWYVISCASLVVFATLPYTGWLLGYFASARLISRASWLLPIGLSGVLILQQFSDWLRIRHIVKESGRIIFFNHLNLNRELLGISMCLLFAGPLLAYNLSSHGPGYFEKLDQYKQLAEVGSYIDKNTSSQVTSIALDYTSTQLLPGVSAHAVLVSFREETLYNGHNFFLSPEQIEERIYASNVIRSLDPGISSEERCRLLRKFNVKFVLAPSDSAESFATEVNKGGMTTKRVLRTKDLVLFELE